MRQRRSLFIAVMIMAALGMLGADAGTSAPQLPQYRNNELLRPENYREWIFLSAGLGMSYNKSAGDHEMFTNVFVPQWAYREFIGTGKWPEKTMFVVEERMAQTKGSINQHGSFKTDTMGIGVEVKDQQKFPDKWAYFNFDNAEKAAKANPKAACWQCHEDHAAVEHSFVQFYPTLKPVAEKFGTYTQKPEH